MPMTQQTLLINTSTFGINDVVSHSFLVGSFFQPNTLNINHELSYLSNLYLLVPLLLSSKIQGSRIGISTLHPTIFPERNRYKS